MKQQIYLMPIGTWFWHHRAECRMMRTRTNDRVNCVSEYGVPMCMPESEEFLVIDREKVIKDGSSVISY